MSDFRHKKILQKKRLFLTDNLVLKGTRVLDQLFQDDVLNHAQFSKMNLETKENEERVSDLLSLLYTRPYDDWEKFLKALSEHNQEHVVKELSVFEAMVDPEIKRLQCLLAEKILEFHNTSEVWQKENEFREVSLDDIFVDLELTKGNNDGGSNTEEEKLRGYRDIYNELLKNRTVVIFGPPGSGKSTLSKRLCCDWAKVQEDNAVATDDLTLHNFSFILPIPLLAVKTDQTFQEYVCETYKIKRKDAQALFNCIEKNQETVVLVLDEKENYNENTSEEMTHLLYRQIFPKVKMLITSRSLSLPAFCNDSPIATLCLQGIPDAGVTKYVKNMYTTEGEGLIGYIRDSEYRKHLSRLPAFLQMIDTAWQEKTRTVDAFFFMFVAYTIRRTRRKQKGAGTLKKSNEEIISENKLLFIMLGQLAKENVKPGKMELQFYWDQVCTYQKDFGDLMFEFLIEHKHKEETVYMFAHETLQEFFLSLFLVNHREPTQNDILLEFCNCRPAFAGSRVEEILQGFQSPDLARNIRIISSGDETQMAALHTQLQLQNVYRNNDVSVTLPKAMMMSTLNYRLDFPWQRYLAMDGSNLVKLTLETKESFLGLLRRLNAPHLTSFTLILAGTHLAQNTANYEQIEEILHRFPLKKLEIKKSLFNSPDYVKSEAITAACRFPGLEELSFSKVCLTIDSIQHLEQRLEESVLKTLTISQCELGTQQLLQLVDAVSRSSSLERLDISGNLNFEDAGQLVDVAEKFSRLRKLNLTENTLSEDNKQVIKDKLKMYPQLEVKM